MSDRLRARIAENRDQIDILIVHGMWSAYSWGLLRAARRARISCIAQPHDPYSPAALASAHTRKRAYWRLVERPFLRGVDAVQLYAPSHREHLERLGVATSSFVVPAGLDARQFEQAAGLRRPASRIEGPIKLLFLGRFDVYNKGLDILLDAMATDPWLRSQATVDIVGGRTHDELRTLEGLVSERGLGDRVRVHWRSDEPSVLLRNSDLLVLPSRFDGFAQVVTEALMFGTPVVVSTEAGSSEFVGPSHGALPAAPSVNDLQRVLAEACLRLPELREAARHAHSYLRRELSWRSCAQRWIDAVDDLRLLTPEKRPKPGNRQAMAHRA